MDLKHQILQSLMSGETSGAKLAKSLGVTRSAVWKAVESLRADGYEINAASGRGYVLRENDALGFFKIIAQNSEWEVETFAEVTSTNDIAKKRAAEGRNMYAAVADSQTSGRGRLGRSFSSPYRSGLYISAVMRPKLSITDCGKITAFAAVAAARAVEKVCGVKVGIKWVNDLYYDGKKLCGILTEGSVGLEGGALEYAVIGIGINTVKTERGMRPSGTISIEEICGKRVSRSALASALLGELSHLETSISGGEFLDDYRRKSVVIGRTVRVNDEYEATALSIDDDCALLLKRGEEIVKFSAGEVSLKL